MSDQQSMMRRALRFYRCASVFLERYAAPVANLAARLWVARIFLGWRYGQVAKHDFHGGAVPLYVSCTRSASRMGRLHWYGDRARLSDTSGPGACRPIRGGVPVFLQHHDRCVVSADGVRRHYGPGALGHIPAFHDGLRTGPFVARCFHLSPDGLAAKTRAAPSYLSFTGIPRPGCPVIRPFLGHIVELPTTIGV